MPIISGFRKVKNYILGSDGYKLLSRWTSSHTVEFDDGKTAQEKINDIELDIAGKIPTSQKGVANGVATLGNDGKIPIDQVPKTALDNLISVVDNDARFILTSDQCQTGDTVKVLDDGTGHEKMYLVVDDTNLDNESGYQPYAANAYWGTILERPDNIVFYNNDDDDVVQVPIGTDFITQSQIVDNLSSTDATLPLSARQGGILKSSLDEMQTEVEGIQEAVGGLNKGLAGKQPLLTNPLVQADVINSVSSTLTNKPLSAAQGRALNVKLVGDTEFAWHTGGYVDVQYAKRCGMATLIISMAPKKTIPTGEWVTLVYIPIAYRPIVDTPFIFIYGNNVYPGIARSDSSGGGIAIYTDLALTSDYLLMGSVSYPINDF